MYVLMTVADFKFNQNAFSSHPALQEAQEQEMRLITPASETEQQYDDDSE